MAIRIKEDTVVTLTYRLTDSEGRLLEERSPENPYEYIHGHGQIISALERQLEGKTAGHRSEVSVSPRDGFGEYNAALLTEISKKALLQSMQAGLSDIEVGMKFNTVGPDGKPVVVRVTEVLEETVTIDGNHPLAGVELVFDVRVLDVREAMESEREQGKVATVETKIPNAQTKIIH